MTRLEDVEGDLQFILGFDRPKLVHALGLKHWRCRRAARSPNGTEAT